MGQDHSKVTPTMGKGKENHINSQMVAPEDVYWQTTDLIVSPAQQQKLLRGQYWKVPCSLVLLHL